MRIEQAIKEYLHTQSKGLINITYQDARHIINLVVGKPEQGVAVAKLYRWNACNSTWEQLRAVVSSDAAIQRETIDALSRKPVEQFYKWECYNSAGEFEGMILTANANLF